MRKQEWIGGMTRRERRAISVLLIIVIAQISFNILWPRLVKDLDFDYSEFSSEIDQFIADSRSAESVGDERIDVPQFDVNKVSVSELVTYGLQNEVAERWLKYGAAIGGFSSLDQIEQIYGLDKTWVNSHRKKLLFPKKLSAITKSRSKVDVKEALIDDFNVNEATLSVLRSMGFSGKTIEVISTLRAAGKRFDDKDDVKYLKGMHPKFYEKIEPFIIVDELVVEVEEEIISDTSNAWKDRADLREDPVVIDVNNSNEFQWQQLNGIGPHFAKSIVKYRQILGGFTSLDQIKETYNLPDSVYDKIKPQLRLTAVFKQIDINAVSVDSLKKHPYIKWKQANIIINFREQHGPFSSMDDFYKIRIFDSIFVEKLEPYILFN